MYKCFAIISLFNQKQPNPEFNKNEKFILHNTCNKYITKIIQENNKFLSLDINLKPFPKLFLNFNKSFSLYSLNNNTSDIPSQFSKQNEIFHYLNFPPSHNIFFCIIIIN